MTTPQSYEDMIRAAQQSAVEGRREILDDLVARFAEAAFRWASSVLDDENAALDAVQEAWLNAYLHLDQLRDSSAFPAWFRQIVLTSAYHAIRRDKPSIPLSDESTEPQSDSDPVGEVEMHERLKHVREVVKALPDSERIVTELYYFSDYSQQEIADALAVPMTTVKKRLQYARQRLKTLIQPEFVSQLNWAVGSNSGVICPAVDDILLGWSPTSIACAEHTAHTPYYQKYSW